MNSQMQAKISNFEFSKEICTGLDFCEFTERQDFLKWTAPECLHHQRFYFESDVYSFGVTLWESTSFGSLPYGDCKEGEVRHRILNNKHLARPECCPQNVYDLLVSCLHRNAFDRPNFEDIKRYLAVDNKESQTFELMNNYQSISSANIALLDPKISEGRYGSVIKGVYTSRDARETTVAVKTVRVPKERQEALNHFFHELRIMSSLRHENILIAIGICEDGSPMLVIELAEFGSLRDYLFRNRTTAVERVLTFMHQVADGMTFMHSRRLVHQSLNATSIVLTSQVQVKISNFDFAQKLDANNSDCDFAERSSFLKWTAPECLKNRKFHLKSDVFQFRSGLVGGHILRSFTVCR